MKRHNLEHVNGHAIITSWQGVSHRRAEARAEFEGREIVLVAHGRAADRLGGFKLMDIIEVRGYRIGPDRIMVTRVKLAWTSILEPGSPVEVVGYMDPGTLQQVA